MVHIVIVEPILIVIWVAQRIRVQLSQFSSGQGGVNDREIKSYKVWCIIHLFSLSCRELRETINTTAT